MPRLTKPQHAAPRAAPPGPAAYRHPDEARRALHRALTIHRALSTGEAPSRAHLAQRFGVTTKTIQRDMEALRGEGAPIAFDRGRKGYVYTAPGFSFRGFSLQPNEQFALMVAEAALAQYEGTDLHAGLAAAFERMGARLPPDVRERHRIVSEALHFGGLPSPRIAPEIWDALLLAIQARQVVRLDYAKLGEAATTRQVHPYQLLARERDWFLVAHLPQRRREVLFYLPRIRSVRLTDDSFRLRRGFDPQAFHRAGFNAMQGPERPVNVELRFAPEAAPLAAERKWAPDQTERTHADGSVSIRFRSAALFEIRRQVLRYEGRVTVIKPASLRRQVAEAARALAEAHGG